MVKIEKISPHEVDFERITKLTALEKKEIVNCLGEEKNVLDVLLTPSEYVDLISEQLGLNSVCRDYFDYRQFLIDQNEGYGNVITLQNSVAIQYGFSERTIWQWKKALAC